MSINYAGRTRSSSLALSLSLAVPHSIAVSLHIVWHFPDGRVRLTIVASFRVATRDLAMWQRWQCGNVAMLPPTTSLGAKSNGSPRFSQVGQRLESHKWQLACCMQPREGASTTDPVGHATCNSNSKSNFDLCNCPALYVVAACHLGSISSSLLELLVASSGYQQISKQPL